MAGSLLISLPYFFLIFLILPYTTLTVLGEEYEYVKEVNPNKMKMLREKMSHFQLYWHDIINGTKATSVPVIQPVANSYTVFGLVNMNDNRLTVGPNMSSKLVGRSEGFYASTSQEEVSLLMVMNFAFSDGKYNGSTITIVGRNNIFAKVREMPIIGGSGLFRFARGYAQAKTYRSDANGNTVVHYDLYVIHY